MFHYQSLDQLRHDAAKLATGLEFDEDLSPLFEPVKAGAWTLPNRFVVLPMEGCDGLPDGSPDELTFRRYRRFAAGGAGLLWVEATAVVREARANPRQLWLHEQTLDAFARLAEEARRAAREAMGPNHRPLLIIQLTHSGRYSRPGRQPQPIIAHHSPFLDPAHGLPPDYPLISDDELERLEDAYVAAARCAQRAGFDGVDLKACHRYLVSELLASHTREGSRYGGSFENRSRFLRQTAQKVRAAVPGLLVSTRMNAFDAMAYPYGFGMDRHDPTRPDLTEPKQLAGFFQSLGAPLINITIGNPYYNPHVNRPFDLPTQGAPLSPEPPLLGVDRFARIVAEIQAAHPALRVIGGGYSWLRQFFVNLAAANVRRGWVSLVGIGRLAFAYPDCVRDLLDKGRLNPEKVCVACSACTQIMRDGGRAGCVPRDAEIYEPIYKAGRAEALDTIVDMASTCRQCNDPSCVSGCPARVNIPRFVGLMAEKRFREAYEVLREANVLATVCGYVCPAEVLCEGRCINQHYDHAVPIRHLQRWVSRKAIEEGWAGEPRTAAAPTGKKVAVVGAGPAGLAAAVRLAELGHQVSLLDPGSLPGGAAQTVLPEDRLPEDILRLEIAKVLESQKDSVAVRQTGLSEQYHLDHLLAEGFDAVLLAVGLGQSSLGLQGGRPKAGVVGALEFLAQVKAGAKQSGTVLVLGGGNTAMDAALGAQKAGATDVSIVYRRSFAEMPAWPEEREKALYAGIHLLTLTAPLEYVADAAGRLTGLRVIRTRLGEKDASGRPSPQPVSGTEHVLPADLVIEAFGQQMSESLRQALPGVQITRQGLVWVRTGSWQTSRDRVFAAGDVVNGGTTVVRAVAEGIQAAMEIHQALTGPAKKENL